MKIIAVFHTGYKMLKFYIFPYFILCVECVECIQAYIVYVCILIEVLKHVYVLLLFFFFLLFQANEWIVNERLHAFILYANNYNFCNAHKSTQFFFVYDMFVYLAWLHTDHLISHSTHTHSISGSAHFVRISLKIHIFIIVWEDQSRIAITRTIFYGNKHWSEHVVEILAHIFRTTFYDHCCRCRRHQNSSGRCCCFCRLRPTKPHTHSFVCLICCIFLSNLFIVVFPTTFQHFDSFCSKIVVP